MYVVCTYLITTGAYHQMLETDANRKHRKPVTNKLWSCHIMETFKLGHVIKSGGCSVGEPHPQSGSSPLAHPIVNSEPDTNYKAQ